MRILSFGAIILATIAPAFAASERPAEMLDEVLAKYGSSSGDVDWARLKRDIAARKKASAENRRTPTARAYLSPAPVNNVAPVVPPSFDTRPHGVLLLRDAYSNQTFISEQDTLSDNGASLSYTGNEIDKTRIVAGKGALFYAMDQWIAPTTVDPNVIRLAHYSLVPGIEWDIKSKKTTSDFGGSASALFGSEFLVRTPWFDASYFKFNGSYTTDVSSGKAQVYGGELTWQPVLLNSGIGTTRRLNRQLDMWVEFVPTLNMNFSHVGDSGDFANLIQGRDYLWTGTELSGRLFFQSGVLAPYSLFAKYYFLYDALHRGNQNVDYKQVGGSAKLLSWRNPLQETDTADLSLTVRYTNGTSLRTLERNDEIYAGLTLKLGSIPTSPAAGPKRSD
ncbi:hypothetical protein QMZ05_05050 [Bradyrhizobium sp. INPA03-11B]|uniref:hypothetical protein n=1 Tax=Bradyrhizobium sp. INPA03-11B TaxID=418598 RepID=UPI0033905A48